MWTLVKQVFEVRYTHEYLYWDRTGYIARGVAKIFPNAEIKRADQDRTVIHLPSEGIQLAYSYNQASAFCDLEDNPKAKFAEIAEHFFREVIASFEIEHIARVGNRFTYTKIFDSSAAAEDHVDKVADRFGVSRMTFSDTGDPRLTSPKITSFSARFDTTTSSVRIEGSHGHVDYHAPHWAADRPQRNGRVAETVYIAQCDVDIVSKTVVTAEQLSAVAMIQSNTKMIETRILPKFA